MSDNLRICVYAISLNEEKHVQRFCESAKDADLILIADTGSTDNTVALAEQFGAKVHHIYVRPWRFDIARNAAMALIPPDIDVCFSLDLDEVLQPGWREEVEKTWVKGETTRLSYMFDWGSGIAFPYTKVHHRDGYLWRSPCHEYPVPDGRTREVYASTDKLLVVHQPDQTKSRGQYLDILQVAIEEDKHDARTRFYWSRELSFHGRWAESIKACEGYLAMPEADWPNERSYAYRVMARCYAELGQWNEALRCARQAVVEAPETREPWAELAALSYRTSRWEECFGAAKSGLAIQYQPKTYTCDPAVWGFQLHDYAAIAAWNLGLFDEAEEQASLAIEKSPNDARLTKNLGLIREGRDAACKLSVSSMNTGAPTETHVSTSEREVDAGLTT